MCGKFTQRRGIANVTRLAEAYPLGGTEAVDGGGPAPRHGQAWDEAGAPARDARAGADAGGGTPVQPTGSTPARPTGDSGAVRDGVHDVALERPTDGTGGRRDGARASTDRGGGTSARSDAGARRDDVRGAAPHGAHASDTPVRAKGAIGPRIDDVNRIAPDGPDSGGATSARMTGDIEARLGDVPVTASGDPYARRGTAAPAELARPGAADPSDDTITPMRFAHVIALDGKGRRKAVPMRWGLTSSFDTKPHIHARAETIDTKPTFRDGFARRRGLVLVTTFNEGEEVTPSRTRQYVVTPRQPVAIAVVWDKTGSGERLLLSFAMVTVEANPLIATITDRMPALIEDRDWSKWLGEEPATHDELKAMLRPSLREMAMRAAEKPRARSNPGPGLAQAELF